MGKIIECYVKPGSKVSAIEGPDENGAYSVKLKARPIDGKANAELLKLISRHFGVRASIKSGCSSKKKLIELI
jgi:uncharacterized protein